MPRWNTAAVRSRTLARLSDERGIALIMALGILFVLTITLGTVIYATSASARHAEHSNASQKSYALAEAGLDNALAVLNTHYPSSTAYPGDTPPGTFLPTRVTTYDEGTATWSGQLQFVNAAGWTWEWAITSIGQVANPTGPGTANVTRTIRAKVPVVMPPNQPVGTDGTLNWIYAGDSARFTNSVTIKSPVYTWHNLSLENGAAISGVPGISGVAQRLAVGGDPVAGGNLNMEQNADWVGKDTPLEAVYIHGLCTSKPVSATLHPCLWGGGPSPNDEIYATTHVSGPVPTDLVIKPELTCCSPVAGAIAPAPPAGGSSQMGFWYQNANLGPNIPCNGTPQPRQPTFDTGDNTINNSATPAIPFNLTPSAGNYTCRNVVDGQTLGELSWDATAKVLTLKGTVFIDGSATVDSAGYPGNPVFTYNGQGTIILSGTFAVKNAKICAAVSGGNCNFSAGAWDPNVKALIVVADGDGGFGGAQSQSNVVDAGNGIQIKGSSYQGALIANKDIDVETTSDEQGPMVSAYHWVNSGQTGVLTFPAVHFAPSGGGGITQPLPTAQLLSPQNIAAG
jgi:Tfp pilus assembly protein PilX